MGDSFLFFTDDDQPSGGNGFPFAYSFTTPDAFHPVAAPFLKIHSWWWKAKNWSLATDAGIVDTNNDAWSMENGPLAPGPSNATTELDLIQPGRAHFFLDTGAQPNSAIQFDVLGAGVISDSGTLYPSFAGNPIVGLDPSKGTLTIFFTNPLGTLPSITGSIDGVSIPIYYDVSTTPAPNSFTFSTFVMTIEDTWTY